MRAEPYEHGGECAHGGGHGVPTEHARSVGTRAEHDEREAGDLAYAFADAEHRSVRQNVPFSPHCGLAVDHRHEAATLSARITRQPVREFGDADLFASHVAREDV